MRTEDIAAAVRGHMPTAEIGRVARLEGGVSAEVFRVDLRQADGAAVSVVLRAMGKSGLDSAQEFALLAALRGAGLPTPQPILLDDSRRDLDAPYVLMAFVEGSSEIPQGAVEAHIIRMAETLASIHRTPLAGLPPLPSRLDPVPELPGFLPEGPEWSALRAYVASLAPSPYDGPPALLHGDFWPRNLLWNEGEVVAILDWEDAACGDPLADIACAQLELRYLFDDWLVDLFVETCRQRRAIDPHRFALWRLYVASAAQRDMGAWGLEPAREAHMRRAALRQIRDAAAELGVETRPPT